MPLHSLKRKTRSDRAFEDVDSDIEACRKILRETERMIAETVVYVSTAGRQRRIRTCDMDDPAETECPAGNAINNDKF